MAFYDLEPLASRMWFIYKYSGEEKVQETFYLNDRNTTTSPALRLVLFIWFEMGKKEIYNFVEI